MSKIISWQRYQSDSKATGNCLGFPINLNPYDIQVTDNTTRHITSNLVSYYDEILEDELVFFMTYSGYMYCYSTQNKTYLWGPQAVTFSGTSGGNNEYSLALSSDGSTIYCTSKHMIHIVTGITPNRVLEDLIIAVNTSDGTIKWSYDASESDISAAFFISTRYSAGLLIDKQGKIHVKSVGGGNSAQYLIKVSDATSSANYDNSLNLSTIRGNYAGDPDEYSICSDNETVERIYISYYSSVVQPEMIRVNASDYTSATSMVVRPGGGYRITGMLYGGSNIIYATFGDGLYKVDFGSIISTQIHIPTGIYVSEPLLSTWGTVLYRAGNRLYDVNPSGSGSENWVYNGIGTDGLSRKTPVLGSDNNIYVTSTDTSGDNVFVINSSGILISSDSIDNTATRYVSTYSIVTPMVGFAGGFYIPFYDSNVPTKGALRVLGAPEEPYSSSSSENYTSSSSSDSESSSSHPTTTTTTPTTTTPTTTTTTTQLSPIRVVKTIGYVLDGTNYIEENISDASDSMETQNTIFAHSFSFGTISPGQLSKTVVVALNVPIALAIREIKLGLVDAGGLPFTTSMFGIASSVELRDDIIPDSYFQGVNSLSSSSSPYNISIPNLDDHRSAYVYLNIRLPLNNSIGTGIMKLQWFFNYAD